MSDEQKKYPEISAGAFITNSKGEIFLMRSPKWGNKLIGPGGHVEYGETYEEALEREVKEETGLEIKNINFLQPVQIIESVEFTKRKAHFVCLDFKAEVVDDKQEVILDSEGTEYFWLKPEEVVKRDDVENTTKGIIEKYFINVKKGLLQKKCKNCDKLEKEAEDYKAGWQRAQADYKNLQKEVNDMRSEWVRMSEQQILEDFIPVYDNFKKAFVHHPELDDDETGKKIKNWIDGIGFIMKQFEKVLQDHNVEEIKTVGEIFNPEQHEAIGEEPASASIFAEATTDKEAMAGEGSDDGREVVVREIESGYVMKGKVIKVAKVILAKNNNS